MEADGQQRRRQVLVDHGLDTLKTTAAPHDRNAAAAERDHDHTRAQQFAHDRLLDNLDRLR